MILSTEELDMLRLLSESYGLSASDWLRTMIRRENVLRHAELTSAADSLAERVEHAAAQSAREIDLDRRLLKYDELFVALAAKKVQK